MFQTVCFSLKSCAPPSEIRNYVFLGPYEAPEGTKTEVTYLWRLFGRTCT